MQFLPKRRGRILVLVLVLALIGCFRSFFFDNLVQPIALFLWAAWRVLASIHQNVYWVLLLAGGLTPLLWLILSRGGENARSAYRLDPLPPGRVEHWEVLLAGAEVSDQGRERLRDEVAGLYQSVSARAARSATDGSDGEAADPGSELPDEFPGLRSSGLRAPGAGRVPLTHKIQHRLPYRLQRRMRVFHTDSLWLRKSLQWMEKELDIPNDH
jgi:hypothetical protein